MDDFFPRARTRRVDGGIRARSTRGAIGSSWWSKRFLEVLESFALGSRLTRGKNYARAGQVLTLDVEPGAVRATVQGSRVKPYRVRVGLEPFDDGIWTEVELRLLAQALFAAQLLAGELPAEIEGVFAAAGAPLFPVTVGDLAMSCSCPDSAVPCKHIAATFYLLAEAFDDDPFQILHWRGRSRDELLAGLRTRDGDGDGDFDGDGDGDAGDGDEAWGDEAGGVAAPWARAVGGRAAGGASPPGDEVGGASPPGAEAGGASPPGAEAGGAPSARASGGAPSARAGSGAPSARAAGSAASARSLGAAAALRDLHTPALTESLDRYWLSPVPLTGKTRPMLAVEPDLLLRQLPTPGPRLGGKALLEALRPLYRRMR